MTDAPDLTAAEALPNEIELVFTRHFDAPRDLVWRAWTDPEMLARWWGPNVFDSTVTECDVRPGGRLYLIMNGQGASHPMSATFHEVDPPRRLVMTAFGEDDAGTAFLSNRMTVTFTEEAGGTRLDAHAQLEAKQLVGRFMIAGMEPGFTQSLDRLAVVLRGA